MEKRDIVVIGGGPGGYVAAIRAAQLGGRVTLVEEEKKLGGTCLNCGCIPTKFLLRSVEAYQSVQNAEQYGISVTGASVDLSKMQARKNKVISTLTGGVKSLLSGNKVEVISGRAKLAPSKQVEIDSAQGKKQAIQADKIIIATGAKPITLPIPGADSPDIMSVDDMLDLEQLPKSMVIIGGGVIGVEMATILAKLGCKVSVVEMMPHFLPTQDTEIALTLQDILREDGIQVWCNSQVTRIECSKGGSAVFFAEGDTEHKVEAEAVTISVGYKPNIDGLGLEESGVTTDRGSIKVNEGMETSTPGIYAVGDAVGGMMLAYIASREGIIAAENATGMHAKIDYQVVPQCIFTLPEIASVGITEQEARGQGYEVEVGRFPFAANGMAMILGEQKGLVKIVSENKYGQILGVHIIGPHATALIMEAAIGIKLEATTEDIIEMIHPHPSLSEAMWEAAMDASGKAIHSHARKKGG